MTLAVCIALVACNDSATKQSPPPAPTPVVVDVDAAVADWTTRCEAALTAKQTPVRRIAMILENCQPCGSWKPLLEWNTDSTAGGPTEQAILDAMDACDAYCSKDSKMQFAGALPDARGKSTNKPWKVLGEKCGDKVSAVPDTRFMSAPFFALDRIARAGAANPKLAPLLATLEIPLPAVSITGVGFQLAESPVMNPSPPPFHVTVSQTEIRIGKLPTAKLGANGVIVDAAAEYPGELVDAKALAAKLPERVVLIAPAAMPAQRLVEVVRAAGKREILLAVHASGAPPGWTLPGIVPVALDAAPAPKSYEWKLDDKVDAAIADLKSIPAEAFAKPRVTIMKTATVAHLAKLLGAIAFRDGHNASLATGK